MAPFQLGRLRRPSASENQEAVEAVRGRQELAKSRQGVRDVSIKLAASGQESGRDESLPFRVWVLRPHVEGG